MLLASSGQTPGMLLKILQGTRQPLTTKHYPAPKVKGAEWREPASLTPGTDTPNRHASHWLRFLEEASAEPKCKPRSPSQSLLEAFQLSWNAVRPSAIPPSPLSWGGPPSPSSWTLTPRKVTPAKAAVQANGKNCVRGQGWNTVPWTEVWPGGRPWLSEVASARQARARESGR